MNSPLRFGWTINTNNPHLQSAINTMTQTPNLCPPGFGEEDGRAFFLDAQNNTVTLVENGRLIVPNKPALGIRGGAIHETESIHALPDTVQKTAKWLSGLLSAALKHIKLPQDGSALNELQMLQVAKALTADIPKMHAASQKIDDVIKAEIARTNLTFDALPFDPDLYSGMKQFTYRYLFEPPSNNDDLHGMEVRNQSQFFEGEPNALFTVYCPESNFTPDGLLIYAKKVRVGESTRGVHSYAGGDLVQPRSPELRQALFEMVCAAFKHDKYLAKYVPGQTKPLNIAFSNTGTSESNAGRLFDKMKAFPNGFKVTTDRQAELYCLPTTDPNVATIRYVFARSAFQEMQINRDGYIAATILTGKNSDDATVRNTTDGYKYDLTNHMSWLIHEPGTALPHSEA